MRSLLTMSLAVLACSISGCAEDVQLLGGAGGGGSGATTTDVQGGGGAGTTSTAGQGGATTTDTLNTGGQGGAGGGPVGDGVHFARFGFRSGQETVGDLCVAYAKDLPDDKYHWEEAGVLGANGLSAADFDGLKRMTTYLPLEKAPVAFGYVYPGNTCADGLVVQQTESPPGVDHFTVIALPYSFEPIVLWVVGDPVAENEADPVPDGFRIVNAALNSYPIEAATTTSGDPPVPHGTFEFGAPPGGYFQAALDHLWTLEVKELDNVTLTPVTFDFTSIDLLPVRPRRTLYVSGLFPDQAWVLACADTMDTQPGDPESSNCFLIEGTP